MAGSRKRRRKAGRTRRILAATLCAASFLTGHLVFGADVAPSRWTQYAAARQELGGSASKPATGLRPATVRPAEDMIAVTDPAEANLAPVVAGDGEAPGKIPLVAARPLPVGVSPANSGKPSTAADDADLPPIVSAASMPRPSQRKAASAAQAQSPKSALPFQIEARSKFGQQPIPGAITNPLAPAATGDAVRRSVAPLGTSAGPSLPGMQHNQFVEQQPMAQQSMPAYPVTNAARSPLPIVLPQLAKTPTPVEVAPVRIAPVIGAPADVAPAFAPVAAEAPEAKPANDANLAAFEEPDSQPESESDDASNSEAFNPQPLEYEAPQVLEVQPPANVVELGRKPMPQGFQPLFNAKSVPALQSQPSLPDKIVPVLTPQAATPPARVTPANEAAEANEEEAAPAQPAVRTTDFTARAGGAFSLQPEEAAPAEVPAIDFGALPEGSPFEAITQSGTINLRVRRSLLMRTKVDIYRTAIVDDSIVELAQFTPREISLIGRGQGQTHVTFWFDDPNMQPVTYLVDVAIDEEAVKADENKYKLLESVVNEMFPDSKVYLVLVADKLLVKGQARDSEEAAQIMAIVRAQSSNYGGPPGYNGLTQGAATPVLSLAATGNNPGPAYTVINMLRVPGVQQVALRVKIAELNRTAARGFGVDVAGHINLSAAADGSKLFLASLLNASSGGGTALIAQVDGDDLNIGIRYAQQRGVIRLLSEPTLVTLSGQPATFIAGGEFAVPTVVGSVGLNAVTTDFRAFGAIISFLPTIVDKDRIRLQVAPEFSQINNNLAVGGTPGLNVRAATTTVEMREGQTLAIAGLLEDTYKGTTVGDLPYLAQIFGRRDASHNETELIILVTPELVQPMEPEEVPPLPGFDVTEPNACEFFCHGDIEGNPTRDHRSTVWPRLRKRYGMGGPAMTSGPFGHGQ